MENERKRKMRGLCRLVFWFYIAAGLCCFLYGAGSFLLERLAERQTAYVVEYAVEDTIAENREILQGLLPERWKYIADAEKLGILQQAANTEANYLGIRKPLSVTIADLEDGTLGRYVLEDHEIQIDTEHVKNSPVQEVLGTICHEAYHGYQIAMVEAFHEVETEKQALLLFREAEIYREELIQYRKGEEDYVGYYNQKLERDARAYSRSAVKDWYEKLECKTSE